MSKLITSALYTLPRQGSGSLGNPDTVRAPDVAFVSQERLEAVGEIEGYWPGAPDLAVEVISLGDSHVEVEEKVFDWLEAGTKMVFTINPRSRSVTVYR
jgi:Uma2 family endonuclease